MTRQVTYPDNSIPHIEGKRRAAIFRTSLAQCNPAVIAAVNTLIDVIARQIAKTSPYLQNMETAREHAEIWVAEKIYKAPPVLE